MLEYHMSCFESPQWAWENFRYSGLRDARRSRRAVRIAEAMARRPGNSIPALFSSPAEVKAAYRFFDSDEATRACKAFCFTRH